MTQDHLVPIYIQSFLHGLHGEYFVVLFVIVSPFFEPGMIHLVNRDTHPTSLVEAVLATFSVGLSGWVWLGNFKASLRLAHGSVHVWNRRSSIMKLIFALQVTMVRLCNL
jgi:hypothetical protein